MSTIQQTVDRALTSLGMIEAGAAATSQDSTDAMRYLNQMMAVWKTSGRDFNWFPQDALSETLPTPDWAEQGIISNLAVICGPEFRSPIPQDLAVKARDDKNQITRTLMNIKLDQADMSHLPQGRYSGRNILTDA